ncbi:MAG: hypothetical protein ACQESR_02300 [Planctomycetota bacterium]
MYDHLPFNKAVALYKPAKGATFKCFFQKLIVFRCVDVVRQLNAPLNIAQDADSNRDGSAVDNCFIREGAEHCMSVEDAERMRGGITYCMKRLQRNEPQGEALRAVFELQLKVYVDPEDYGDTTKKLVVERSGIGKPAVLAIEYDESCMDLKKHQKELANTEHDVRESYAVMYRYRFTLETSCHSIGDVLRLENCARNRNIGDLEEELRAAQKKLKTAKNGLKAAKLRSRCDEINFMIALIRLRTTEKRRAKELKIQDDWERCRGKWVRSQQYVGELIGLSQGDVNKKLATAREHLQICVEARLRTL